MKGKLLILAALLCVFALGVEPAPAVPTCDWLVCFQLKEGPCICPHDTLAHGSLMDCSGWRADCNYL